MRDGWRTAVYDVIEQFDYLTAFHFFGLQLSVGQNHPTGLEVGEMVQCTDLFRFKYLVITHARI